MEEKAISSSSFVSNSGKIGEMQDVEFEGKPHSSPIFNTGNFIFSIYQNFGIPSLAFFIISVAFLFISYPDINDVHNDTQMFSASSQYLYSDENNKIEFHIHDLCPLDKFVKIDIIPQFAMDLTFSGEIQIATFQNEAALNNFSQSFSCDNAKFNHLVYLNPVNFDHMTMNFTIHPIEKVELQRDKFQILITTHNRLFPSSFYLRYFLFYFILLSGFFFFCNNQYTKIQLDTILLIILGILVSIARYLDKPFIVSIFNYAIQIYLGVLFQLSIHSHSLSLIYILFLLVYILDLFIPSFLVTMSNKLLDSNSFLICLIFFLSTTVGFLFSILRYLKMTSFKYFPIYLFIMFTFYFNFLVKYAAFDWKTNYFYQQYLLLVPLIEAIAVSFLTSISLPAFNLYTRQSV